MRISIGQFLPIDCVVKMVAILAIDKNQLAIYINPASVTARSIERTATFI